MRAAGAGRSPGERTLRRFVIEISGRAWSADPLTLPDDTRQALETDGRTELLKVLDQDQPPHVIRCDCSGCSYLSASEAAEWPDRP
jgi:hypothetical protein